MCIQSQKYGEARRERECEMGWQCMVFTPEAARSGRVSQQGGCVFFYPANDAIEGSAYIVFEKQDEKPKTQHMHRTNRIIRLVRRSGWQCWVAHSSS